MIIFIYLISAGSIMAGIFVDVVDVAKKFKEAIAENSDLQIHEQRLADAIFLIKQHNRFNHDKEYTMRVKLAEQILSMLVDSKTTKDLKKELLDGLLNKMVN